VDAKKSKKSREKKKVQPSPKIGDQTPNSAVKTKKPRKPTVPKKKSWIFMKTTKNPSK